MSINDTLYIDITNNLKRRIKEHKTKIIPGFTSKYKCCKLVYFEEYPQVRDALKREKQLKNWHREWKLNLIKTLNPTFIDLNIE